MKATLLLILISVTHFISAQNRTKQFDSILNSLYTNKKINGNFLVAEKGKVIYSKSFGYADVSTKELIKENSVFELASCSKQFTAMAIMVLKEKGKLKLDDDLAKYIPELDFYKSVTIRNLLNHTGGLPDYMELMDTTFDKTKMAGQWLRFPWEHKGEVELEENILRVIEYFDDPTREGLKDTPKRYVKFLKEFFAVPNFEFTAFDSEGMDEMILQTNIPFYSLCEHHIAPFFGVAHVAYIPNGKIVGLSKLARTVDFYSRRLQNQERITQQIADRIQKELSPVGVAVVLKAQHLCMAMRGVKKHDTWTTTSKMNGVFRTDLNCRQEFLNLIK